MLINYGCEITISVANSTPVLCLLDVHPERRVDIAVDDDDVILPYPQVVATGGIVKSLAALHAAAEDIVVGYRGKKQYVKVMTDFGGTHGTGTIFGISWVMTHPMSAPTWQAAVTDRPQI